MTVNPQWYKNNPALRILRYELDATVRGSSKNIIDMGFHVDDNVMNIFLKIRKSQEPSVLESINSCAYNQRNAILV